VSKQKMTGKAKIYAGDLRREQRTVHQDYIIVLAMDTKKIRMECLSLMKKKQELLEEFTIGILKDIVLVES